MAETDVFQQGQNSVEIHYVTTDGVQLLPPTQLSQLVGAQYQIMPPIIDGFVLVNRPEELMQTMTATAVQIDLVYAKLGTLHIYHSLTDITGELIPLKNGQTADSVAPVQLQSIPAHNYYLLIDDGLGDLVSDTEHFQPIRVDGTTKLISLTEEERQQMMDLEESLTLEVAEALAGQPIPQQPKPKPLPESTQPAQPQPSATYPSQTQPSIGTPMSSLNTAPQMTSSRINPTESMQVNSGQVDPSQIQSPGMAPNVEPPQSSFEANKAPTGITSNAVGALARGIIIISRGLAQESPQNKPVIAELTQSALRLIQAIRRLA